MALFKVCRGNETELPTTKRDGYAYFCSDTGNFYIDVLNTAGNLERIQVNAGSAAFADEAEVAQVAQGAEALVKLNSDGEVEDTIEFDDVFLTDMIASVAQGGTGRTTLTSNAVLTGNGTSAVNQVATASGALYSASSGAAPTFGTLPVAQGGTGRTTIPARSVVIGNGTSAATYASAASGALYSTGTSVTPKFGTLPVAQGGTGATTNAAARTSLDVYSKSETTSAINSAVTAATSTTYTATLGTSSWSGSGSSWSCTLALTGLTCGADGNTPPIITWTSGEEAYNCITSATATAGSGITFYAEENPGSIGAIGLIIIDIK